MRAEIRIFGTKFCRYCLLAKNYFKENGLAFEEIDLTDQQEEIEKLKAKTGHKTVPMIFVNEKFVGGYTDMIAQIESGKLVLK